MRYLLVILASALVLTGCKNTNTALPSPAIQQQTQQKTDFKAAFAIFTSGTYRLFTDPKYHNLSSDVFLTAENPNVINVKTEDVTWNDFFKTLPIALSEECLTTGTGQEFCTGQRVKLKFYLNGQQVENLFNRKIKEGDKVLISFGPINDPFIENQLKRIPAP